MEEKFCYACDVLGYKNILINLPLSDQQARIEDWKSLIDKGIKKFNVSEHIISSDTLFVSEEYDVDNLKRLLNFAKFMLTEGTKKCFPIRGAVTLGEVVLDKEKSLAYGKAVVDAYLLAEKQDWIGTCGDSHLPFLDSLWDFDLIFVYPAPMKGGTVIYCPVISWDIPAYADLWKYTTRLGLTDEKEDVNWKCANRIQNTMMLKWYLNGAKKDIIKAKPRSFSDLPMKHINDLVDDLLSDANLRKHGYTATRTPDGKTTYTRPGGRGPIITKK